VAPLEGRTLPHKQRKSWTSSRTKVRRSWPIAEGYPLSTFNPVSRWLAALLLLMACGPSVAAELARDVAQAATGAASSGQIEPKAVSSSEREAAYVAQLDKIVAPLRDYDLSADDIAKMSAAFKALSAGDIPKAQTIQAGVSDPLGRRLIDWERLRRGKGEAAEYLKFLAENPDWPSREQLQRQMEETLFEQGGGTDVIATYFKDGAARSPAGMAVLASVHLAHGEKDQAKALAVKVWREKDLPASLERGFLTRFGSMLTEQDHKWRLDRLLVDDVRYKTDRDERAALAKRVIPLLSAGEQKTAQARLAVFMRAGRGKGALGNAQHASGTDWGVVFHKIQQFRQAGKVEDAAKLLRTAPTDATVVANLDDWWNERQSLAYLALKARNPKLAYELVRDAGPIGVNAHNDQTFMAGWIALRYLNDVKLAEKHFADLVRTADGPLSRGRANYWMGRTAEKLGDRERARASYKAAAREVDTFHGLLAMQKLRPGRQKLTIDAPAMPTSEQAAKFTNHDAAKAIALARKADLGRGVTRVFLLNVAKIDKDEAWAAMAAHLARVTGDTQTAVRIGKAAIANGQNLLYYSYPVHALPTYTPLRPPPEPAVLLGLARQETEFNSDTVSGAGARGILQVMKVTASHVCRDYKIKCTHDRLLTDSSYNTMIASAYVADRMAEWSGSYVLALSSYNAGPGRTRQWIGEFGDPRTPGVDPIDWIERIPIEETRRYVAKVLSNIQIYRARLGDETSALRLDEDLSRARSASNQPAGKTNTADSRK
jgi:soluble lytic murein transglycosylase